MVLKESLAPVGSRAGQNKTIPLAPSQWLHDWSKHVLGEEERARRRRQYLSAGVKGERSRPAAFTNSVPLF